MKAKLLIATIVLAAAACETAKNSGQLVGDELRATSLAGKSLTRCPESSACVSSIANDTDHFIAPLPYSGGDDAAAMARAKRAVLALGGGDVEYESASYLHATFRSTVFGFVDDVELRLDRAHGVMQVRSASRFGIYDWGVNRRRVEALREALKRP